MREAQGRLNAREFAEWLAFEELSPGEPERTDLLIASVRWQIWAGLNAQKGESKSIEDFLIFKKPERAIVKPSDEVFKALDRISNWHSRQMKVLQGGD